MKITRVSTPYRQSVDAACDTMDIDVVYDDDEVHFGAIQVHGKAIDIVTKLCEMFQFPIRD